MFKNDDLKDYNPINNTPTDTKEPETIIGPSVKVEGNFRGDGNVMIDGEVKGSIKTKRDVKVGEGANVKANIECINAIISGNVDGNIKTKEKLELNSTAVINGDITAKTLQINAGAKINGHIKMDEESLIESIKPKNDSDEKTAAPAKAAAKYKKK